MLICILASIFLLAFLFVLILGYALLYQAELFLDQNR